VESEYSILQAVVIGAAVAGELLHTVDSLSSVHITVDADLRHADRPIPERGRRLRRDSRAVDRRLEFGQAACVPDRLHKLDGGAGRLLELFGALACAFNSAASALAMRPGC
jgi:hypothetical protein